MELGYIIVRVMLNKRSTKSQKESALRESLNKNSNYFRRSREIRLKAQDSLSQLSFHSDIEYDPDIHDDMPRSPVKTMTEDSMKKSSENKEEGDNVFQEESGYEDTLSERRIEYKEIVPSTNRQISVFHDRKAGEEIIPARRILSVLSDRNAKMVEIADVAEESEAEKLRKLPKFVTDEHLGTTKHVWETLSEDEKAVLFGLK